jgi:1,4-dihydroxy-2-naphthoate octaprenyltransferase
MGTASAIRLYALLETLPFALAALLAWHRHSVLYALPLVALPWAIRLVRDVSRTPDGPAQNALLFRTVLLEVAFGMLLAAVVARRLNAAPHKAAGQRFS